MRIHSEVFWLPKAGNTEDEYEDAFWPQDAVEATGDTFSFAIADGATETSFSASWAQILVKAYCEGQFDSKVCSETLGELQAKWIAKVSSEPLPWYAEEKLRMGAFSTLLGLKLQDKSKERGGDGSANWEAIAVGDSCLFQVRHDELIVSFPLDRSQDFNSRPLLISSREENNQHLNDHVLDRRGTLEVGDSLYLMTDALAFWFLTAYERRERPWKIQRWRQFESWVNRLRRSKRIRNDDVTILRIERWLDQDED